MRSLELRVMAFEITARSCQAAETRVPRCRVVAEADRTRRLRAESKQKVRR